jgi:hypothetical protein
MIISRLPNPVGGHRESCNKKAADGFNGLRIPFDVLNLEFIGLSRNSHFQVPYVCDNG